MRITLENEIALHDGRGETGIVPNTISEPPNRSQPKQNLKTLVKDCPL